MTLVSLSFHHIKTSYENFQKLRFTNVEEFYKLTEGILDNRILVQTGTRVEIYTVITDIYRDVEKILQIFEEKSGLDKEMLKGFFKILMDHRAIEHLFRLSCCIESRVMGETYIPWQVEGALAKAKEMGAAKSNIIELFQEALSLSRTVKEKTNIEGTIPVAKEVLALVSEEMPSLNEKSVVLLGAGLSGIKSVKALKENGIKDIFVLNRNLDIGKRTALELGAIAVPYKEKEAIISKADILICATLASHYRVTKKLLSSNEREKDLMVIDISPFRNVDPDVRKLPGIILRDEKVREAMEKNFKTQQSAVPEVERIVQKAVEVQNRTGSF